MPEEYGGKNGTLEDIQSKDGITDLKINTILQKDEQGLVQRTNKV